jgi:hypothetical protein
LRKIEDEANRARVNLIQVQHIKEIFNELINFSLKSFLMKNLVYKTVDKLNLDENFKRGYELSNRLFKPVSEIMSISKEIFGIKRFRID